MLSSLQGEGGTCTCLQYTHVHVLYVHEQRTRQQSNTIQHNSTTPETTPFFLKKKLPQVGLEPTTLCSLDECSNHIIYNTIQCKARCLNTCIYYSTGSQYSVYMYMYMYIVCQHSVHCIYSTCQKISMNGLFNGVPFWSSCSLNGA